MRSPLFLNTLNFLDPNLPGLARRLRTICHETRQDKRSEEHGLPALIHLFAIQS